MMNETVQYIIVGVVLLAAAVYIAMKLVNLRKKGKIDSCCGCTLSENCNKKHNKKDCHENH
ncbi:MAG: FeoB-associated Cys-rich membrane protein [Muribaculaceae bacterium]|nr:FeoB-associated Cys-rich membrane protein [Muribaculaceae bacterium]